MSELMSDPDLGLFESFSFEFTDVGADQVSPQIVTALAAPTGSVAPQMTPLKGSGLALLHAAPRVDVEVSVPDTTMREAKGIKFTAGTGHVTGHQEFAGWCNVVKKRGEGACGATPDPTTFNWLWLGSEGEVHPGAGSMAIGESSDSFGCGSGFRDIRPCGGTPILWNGVAKLPGLLLILMVSRYLYFLKRPFWIVQLMDKLGEDGQASLCSYAESVGKFSLKSFVQGPEGVYMVLKVSNTMDPYALIPSGHMCFKPADVLSFHIIYSCEDRSIRSLSEAHGDGTIMAPHGHISNFGGSVLPTRRTILFTGENICGTLESLLCACNTVYVFDKTEGFMLVSLVQVKP